LQICEILISVAAKIANFNLQNPAYSLEKQKLVPQNLGESPQPQTFLAQNAPI